MLLKLMSRTSTISSYFSVKNFCRWQLRLVVQAGEQLGVHAGDAGRRFAQAFAVGIFADGGQNLADCPFDARQIDGRADLALPLLSDSSPEMLPIRCDRSALQVFELAMER